MAQTELLQRAQQLGVNLNREPAERIVITGVAQLTPLGNTEETWKGLLEGKSGVREFLEARNSFVKIAAPVNFRPEDHFDKKALRGLSPLNAMAIMVAQEATKNADLKLPLGLRFGSFVGSGIGSTQHLIDPWRTIHKIDADGNEDPERNSRFIPATKGLEIFPEELNGGISRALGLRGTGASSVEACATGLGNPVIAAELMRSGVIQGAVAGGFDDPFEAYPEVGLGIFAGMRSVLSTRNDNPQAASRPFDKDRDGFVEGAGGAVVVMEDYEQAKKRGAPILAEVLGFAKSMDGGESATGIDIDNVASTILRALWDEKHQMFHEVDAIFAHATATEDGDLAEAQILRKVFGYKAREIPITAIKSNFGHLLGGAGSVNLVNAVFALIEGKIPPILNLENPDPEFEDLFFVREKPLERPINTALVLAYGFGGHNAVMVLGKYQYES